MLKRLYIDNYKCFSNFEYRPGQVELLVGGNGAGKSSIFEVLSRLRELLLQQEQAARLFPTRSLTRWDSRAVQTFELDAAIEDGADPMCYHLEIEHLQEGRRGDGVKVRAESLTANGQMLFEYRDGESYLYRDDGSAGPIFRFDGWQSALAFVSAGPDNKRLTQFRDGWVGLMRLLHMDPRSVGPYSDHRRTSVLDHDASNFASWLHTQMAELPELRDRLRLSLSEIWGATVDWRFEPVADERSVLKFKASDTGAGSSYLLGFDELSDGERALMILYAVYHATMLKEQPGLLCIDEPGAYLSLREVQPLLATCYDDFADAGQQLLIASHHPDVINFLAPEHAVVVARSPAGPTRSPAPFPMASDSGLVPSERVARGGLDE